MPHGMEPNMNIDFPLFFSALGLAFVLEACLWIIAPGKMRGMVYQLAELSDDQLRKYGFAVIAAGLFFCTIGHYLRG